ncbi:hypothetical protein WOLCODRAFT_17255 [Wolfiporia cocos MD-104 SS10]|uniref:Uncharacterized protein n=1 Tax=Wolfiporia cocos (strain MD-104) TaxID=742152 RepID=A0A2H3JY46_WOLCO|nr:hypothetical protein WOLCODRAFT_17255 [Wolfiporia cocos MD-104 SS10]
MNGMPHEWQVPRPHYKDLHGSLQVVMHLKNNPTRFKDATAVEGYPFFKKYEDYWPIAAYLGRYLQACARDWRKKQSKESAKQQPKPSSRDNEVIVCSGQAERTTSCSNEFGAKKFGTSPTRSRSVSSMGTIVLSHSTRVCNHRSVKRSGWLNPVTFISRNQQAANQIALYPPVQSQRWINLVQLWCICHRPDYEYLVPQFIRAGIKSDAHLHDVARWPEAERDALLRTDMQLTAFEFRSIRMAFANLIHTIAASVAQQRSGSQDDNGRA